MTPDPAPPIAADERTLYVSDREIARRLGIGERRWRANARVLEQRGLPRPDPLFADKRYWPAVRAFLDRRSGLTAPLAAAVIDGEENWNG